MRFILTPFLFLALTSCASSQKVTCNETDWYEAGRKDGAQGATLERLAQHQKTCGDSFQPEWESVYTNGRNAGLVEFCDARNGFDLGRMGIAYYYVCPSTNEPAFLSEYRRGQQARQLEIDNKKLDAQIDSMSQRISSEDSDYERTRLSSQLESLKRTRARNERQLGKINPSRI